ncbi:MAG TPA: hypothetical protein VEY91_13095 [Candidatus Limnocylindria bacterium]|nr:hypothetical protein [Candidatus Limnocylindria bacterium]
MTTEHVRDRRRAQELGKLLRARRAPEFYLVPRDESTRERLKEDTNDRQQVVELHGLAKQYGVGNSVAQGNTLQEYVVAIIQAIDNLQPAGRPA